MSKRGKIIFCLLLALIIVYLLLPKSRTVSGISDGSAYCMVTESEDALAPWIWFDISGRTIRFTSSLDSRISRTTSGTVELRRGKVYTVSDDAEQIWIFDVIDNDTLEFVEKGSTIPVDSDGDTILFDGARFKRTDK